MKLFYFGELRRAVGTLFGTKVLGFTYLFFGWPLEGTTKGGGAGGGSPPLQDPDFCIGFSTRNFRESAQLPSSG